MVTRYNVIDQEEHLDCEPDGEFVQYIDYAALEELCEELRASLESEIKNRKLIGPDRTTLGYLLRCKLNEEILAKAKEVLG